MFESALPHDRFRRADPVSARQLAAPPPLIGQFEKNSIIEFMAKKSRSRKRKGPKKPRDHVIVSNRGYGQSLKGTPIYFEGAQPKALRDDGRITFGKHILETLKNKFDRFRWIITLEDDSITVERGIVRVRTSRRLLARMNKENWDRSRDIKNDIVARFF